MWPFKKKKTRDDLILDVRRLIVEINNHRDNIIYDPMGSGRPMVRVLDKVGLFAIALECGGPDYKLSYTADLVFASSGHCLKDRFGVIKKLPVKVDIKVSYKD